MILISFFVGIVVRNGIMFVMVWVIVLVINLILVICFILVLVVGVGVIGWLVNIGDWSGVRLVCVCVFGVV